MGISTDDLAGEKDYAFWLTLHDVLRLVEQNLNRAKEADNNIKLGMALKMASRALRCALEIYGDRVAEMQKEKT